MIDMKISKPKHLFEILMVIAEMYENYLDYRINSQRKWMLNLFLKRNELMFIIILSVVN